MGHLVCTFLRHSRSTRTCKRNSQNNNFQESWSTTDYNHWSRISKKKSGEVCSRLSRQVPQKSKTAYLEPRLWHIPHKIMLGLNRYEFTPRGKKTRNRKSQTRFFDFRNRPRVMAESLKLSLPRLPVACKPITFYLIVIIKNKFHIKKVEKIYDTINT